MSHSSVYFVGRADEVCHHAQPFKDTLAVQIVNAADVIELAQTGDLAIFFSEHFDRFRHAIEILKQRQVATLYMLDGILEWRNAWENRPDEPACPFTMRPVLCHKAACIGFSQARVLDSWGNREKTEVVGIPRLDRLQRLSPRQPTGDSFRVLVMTAKVPGFTPQQVERTKQSLTDLKLWLEQEQRIRANLNGKKLEIVWRLTAGLDRDLQVENQCSEISGSELVEQLLHVDAVISTPSTAMLEAMVLGLPVASLNYHCCPMYVPTAWTISHRDGIANVIAELSDPSPPKLFFQQMQLEDALALAPRLGRAPGKQTATDRFIQLVQGMQEITHRQLAHGEPIQFPAALLPPLEEEGSPFIHRDLYSKYRPIFDTDSVSTQVELAHARREIDHLNKEIRQLKSELAQAHSIFEQIQQHPVAGPIVRLRQRFIDWFSRNQSEVLSK
jgi:hypothetical protein